MIREGVRLACALLLLAQPLAAGCATLGELNLGAADSVEPGWWEPDRSAFEDWPGMSQVNVTPPENEWLRDHIRDSINEPFEPGDQIPLRYQAADRLLWVNASHWAFNDAESVAWGEVKDTYETQGFNETDLFQSWNRTADRYHDAWTHVNDTGLSLLAAPLENYQFVEHVGYEQLQQDGDLDSAASIGSYVHHTNAIIDNATTMPGDPVANITHEDVKPLLDVVGDPLFAVSYSNELPEQAAVWVYLTQYYQDKGWLHAATMTGLISLITHEVLHMVYQNEAPAVDDVHNALASLNQSAHEPLHEYPAQFAWRAAVLAHDDPAFMITPVATDRVWPLIDEITNLLVTGDPVDWTLLDQLEQRWQQTWIPVLEEDWVPEDER